VSEADRIPFPNWAPIPRWIFGAVQDGVLTPTQGRVLMVVYERANQGTWIARFHTIDTLATRLAWEHSNDYLSKVLRGLRSEGWIAFETMPGRTRQGYEIRVLHDRIGESEHSPSRNGAPSPSSDDAPVPVVEPNLRATQSEHQNGPSPRRSPSRPPLSPSNAEAAGPVPERDPGDDGEGPVRAAQDLSREAKALRGATDLGRESHSVTNYDHLGDATTGGDLVASTDRMLDMLGLNAGGHEGNGDGPQGEDDDADAGEPDATLDAEDVIVADIDWPDTTHLDTENAIIADAEFLSVPSTEPPLCSHPAHRDAGDWLGHDGPFVVARLVCSVCHPRGERSASLPFQPSSFSNFDSGQTPRVRGGGP
jgi:hypothetical protein